MAYTTLAVDIGGTNIRLGLLAGNQHLPARIQAFQINNFPDLATVIQHYLNQTPSQALRQVGIAVATPVLGDRVKLTNHDWNFSIRAIGQTFTFQHVKVVNDFTALALSLPLLADNERLQLGGKQGDPDGCVALLGPGTGLGVSGLIKSANGIYPLAGEGGHVTLGARNERELAIFSSMWQRHDHMSAERLLSGTGIAEIYQIICQLDQQPDQALSPEEISQRAMAKQCSVCDEVMMLFCEWLGIVAANLALTLGATAGVYIGGGIVPKLGDYFLTSAFREAFERKGRFQPYLNQIPVYLIQAEQPALRGAALALHPRYKKTGIQLLFKLTSLLQRMLYSFK